MDICLWPTYTAQMFQTSGSRSQLCSHYHLSKDSVDTWLCGYKLSTIWAWSDVVMKNWDPCFQQQQQHAYHLSKPLCGASKWSNGLLGWLPVAGLLSQEWHEEFVQFSSSCISSLSTRVICTHCVKMPALLFWLPVFQIGRGVHQGSCVFAFVFKSASTVIFRTAKCASHPLLTRWRDTCQTHTPVQWHWYSKDLMTCAWSLQLVLLHSLTETRLSRW